MGKSYAMLNEGRRRKERGTDVVIGFVECHGRQLTENMIGDLEVVPRKQVDYRGAHLTEVDLDAVLRRRPTVALVDELAHTNVPGSGRNEKRWQDVVEILAAGIDVITTVQGRPDRAGRLLTRAAAPQDAARQHLPEGEGLPGAEQLLPYRQPHRAARAGAAVPG